MDSRTWETLPGAELISGLNGVNHRNIRFFPLHHFPDRLEICLTQKRQFLVKFSDAVCTELNLAQRFLT